MHLKKQLHFFSNLKKATKTRLAEIKRVKYTK